MSGKNDTKVGGGGVRVKGAEVFYRWKCLPESTFTGGDKVGCCIGLEPGPELYFGSLHGWNIALK